MEYMRRKSSRYVSSIQANFKAIKKASQDARHTVSSENDQCVQSCNKPKIGA